MFKSPQSKPRRPTSDLGHPAGGAPVALGQFEFNANEPTLFEILCIRRDRNATFKMDLKE